MEKQLGLEGGEKNDRDKKKREKERKKVKRNRIKMEAKGQTRERKSMQE